MRCCCNRGTTDPMQLCFMSTRAAVPNDGSRWRNAGLGMEVAVSARSAKRSMTRRSPTTMAAQQTSLNHIPKKKGTVRLVASGGRSGSAPDPDGGFIVAEQLDGQPLAIGHSVSGIPDTPGICIARNETTSNEVALLIDLRGLTPGSVARVMED